MPGPHHEHEFEPAPGLPERLPATERQLWQGAPSAAWMARKVFHLPWVAGYFALLLAWQGFTAWHDGAAWGETALGLAGGFGLAAVALGLLGLLAVLSARTTLYTLTDRRLVMRVGIVLTVSYNLPLRCIDAANVHPLGGSHGDLALTLQPEAHIAWLHLWPHARPWHLRRTQPMLRCLPRAAEVAALLAQAWSAANAQAASRTPAAHPAPPAPPVRQPSLSGLVAGR